LPSTSEGIDRSLSMLLNNTSSRFTNSLYVTFLVSLPYKYSYSNMHRVNNKFTCMHKCTHAFTHNTHTHVLLCPGLPGWAGTRTNLDFTEARDSEWQWHQMGRMQICTTPRQITMPVAHHSVFYRPYALPAI